MFKKFIVTLVMITGMYSTASAADIAVLSIDPDFKFAVLEDTITEVRYQAEIGDIVTGWKVEGITKDYVTISKVINKKIYMTRLYVSGGNRIVGSSGYPAVGRQPLHSKE